LMGFLSDLGTEKTHYLHNKYIVSPISEKITIQKNNPQNKT